MKTGTQVRVTRDPHRYPPRGSWPRFANRVGTVVEINHDRRRANLTEYGVCFASVRQRADRDGLAWDSSAVAWFKRHELLPIT